MNHIIKVEWIKLRHYKQFWFLIVLYFFLTISSLLFLSDITSFISTQDKLTPFSFGHVWTTVSTYYSFFNVFISIIIILSITNDFNFNTYRQHIIDGWEKSTFLLSKIGLIISLSLSISIFFILVGLILGFVYSPDISFQIISKGIYHVALYALKLTAALSLAMFVAILIRKAALSIILLCSIYFIEMMILGNIKQLDISYGPIHVFYELLPIGKASIPLFRAIIISLMYIGICWLSSLAILKYRNA